MRLRNLLLLKINNLSVIGSLSPAFFLRSSGIMMDFIKFCETREPEQALEEIKKNHSTIEVHEFIKRLEKNRNSLFEENPCQSGPIENTNAGISTLTFNLTRRCNLRCSYCFEDEGYRSHSDMTFETARKAIDTFFVNRSSPYAVVFTGGEPILNYGTLREIVQYIQSLGMNVKYRIKTNGTLLNESVTDFLIKNEFKVQISIDGDKKAHNTHRKWPDGKGSFDHVDRAIRRFIDREYGCNVNLAGVYSTRTVGYIDDSFRHLNGYAGCKYELKPVMQNSADQYALKSGDYISVCEAIKRNPLILPYFQSAGTNEKKLNICGIGVWNITIDTDGKIYPCYRMCGDEKYILGTLDSFEMPFRLPRELSDIYHMEKNPLCSNCYLINSCREGCYTDKVMGGDVSTQCINPMKKIMENIITHELLQDGKYLLLDIV